MKHKNIITFFIWFFLMQLVVWFLLFSSVALWFLDIDGIVGLTALAAMVLCYFWGYILSKRIQIDNYKPVIILSSIWALVSAVLIYFTHDSGIGWTLSFPYRAIAQTLFPSCFSSPQSAFVLNVLRPLLIACSYILTLLAFGVGVYINRRDKK